MAAEKEVDDAVVLVDPEASVSARADLADVPKVIGSVADPPHVLFEQAAREALERYQRSS